MSVFPLTAPVLYFLHCFQTAIVICTTSEGSPFRVCYSLWLVYTTYQFHLKTHELCADCIQKLYINLFAFVHTVHCINLLLITGLDGETVAHRKQPHDHAGISWRVWSALEMTFNPRGINTPWQIRSIPHFSPFFPGKPGRAKFLVRQLFVLVWQYLVLDVLLYYSHEAWTKGKRLSHLDVPDGLFSMQTVSQMVASFFVTRLSLDLIHRSLSIFCVATFLSAPHDWPPMFGSMWDTYTLSLFWGEYCHQLLRWPFTGVCSFAAHSVVRSPQPSRYKRYTTFMFVFMLSSLLHQFGSYSMAIPLRDSNAPVFCFFTGVGVLIEEAFQNSLCGKLPAPTASPSTGFTILKRIVGYLWVLAWLGSSGSYLIYQTVTIAIVNKSVGVPYSMVESAGLQTTGALIAVGALVLKLLFKTSL